MGRRAARTATLGEGHKTVTGALAEAIRRRILDGSYATGMKLQQDMLAAEFGVSRIPVREALFQLDAEGLVTIEPQRGATVSSLSPERMTETLELRAILEPYLLRCSAPRLTDEDFAALDRLLADYAAAIEAHAVNRWGELNTTFHLGLYARAGRPRAVATVATLLRESDRYTRVQLAASAEYQRRAQAEHLELLRLCRAGEVEAAATLLQSHVSHVRETLGRILGAAQV
ncbi:GntR family transcriptional regulator [Neoroseomonas oryzicola]|uniref:GntR family transcriptional regulator n=1 Tax=Neoroseomonas oryzicola TaxID=535904 RepID=A0A9X9WN78_9PROT|nr:GntR family transcriptional regulator [Neoroseomonas oryzicola]MBR0661788.1 GntR family transcriptional regulator [Neoroseomonas oryzicola]NKE17962.1 GntR family transcriptional regulator [Neoroseomonas oryzicola]